MVLLVRTVHGLLSAFFLACIGYVYYAAFAGIDSPLAIGAIAALLLEGSVVVLNRGDCPLGSLHRRFGDEKAFFELLLPQGAAKLAVPVLGAVTGVGILLLFARSGLPKSSLCLVAGGGRDAPAIRRARLGYSRRSFGGGRFDEETQRGVSTVVRLTLTTVVRVTLTSPPAPVTIPAP